MLTITVERDTVYVGGAFRTLAALDAQSGQANPWAAYPDSSVMAIVSANHLLYVGGGFEEIGGRLRPALAGLNPRIQTPNALDWTPAPWSDLQPATIRALAASSSALFVVGRFEVAGGEPRGSASLPPVVSPPGGCHPRLMSDTLPGVRLNRMRVQLAARAYPGIRFSTVVPCVGFVNAAGLGSDLKF